MIYHFSGFSPEMQRLINAKKIKIFLEAIARPKSLSDEELIVLVQKEAQDRIARQNQMADSWRQKHEWRGGAWCVKKEE